MLELFRVRLYWFTGDVKRFADEYCLTLNASESTIMPNIPLLDIIQKKMVVLSIMSIIVIFLA